MKGQNLTRMPEPFKCCCLLLLLEILLTSVTAHPTIHTELSQRELVQIFEVGSHTEVPVYEVVKVRLKRSLRPRSTLSPLLGRRGRSPESVLYYAQVMGRNLEMNLQKNHALVVRNMSIVRKTSRGRAIPIRRAARNCHYIGVNGSVVAAFSECDVAGGISGVILLAEEVLQVKPLPARLRPSVQEFRGDPGRGLQSEDVPHVIFPAWNHKLHLYNHIGQERGTSLPTDKRRFGQRNRVNPPRTFRYQHPDRRRTPRPQRYPHPDRRQQQNKSNTGSPDKRGHPVVELGPSSAAEDFPQRRPSSKTKFLELAIFVDEKAYGNFVGFLGGEAKLTDFILGYINQVQAIYLQPSLQEKVHISLVHLELLEKQPADLPHYSGNRDLLLSSFCKYQSKRNPGDDSHPRHWDTALYLSGLNFFAIEGGRKNVVTMGLAPVGGVCYRDHNCVITELGTTSDAGKPYPSAGWTSAYVAAHEIGHNLGMLHDGWPNNDCSSNGFIMSPSRGTKGETSWSSCSAHVVHKMGDRTCLSDKPDGVQNFPDHQALTNLPGQEWDSHEQCKIFLRDSDAELFNASLISYVCEQVICKTPNRQGFYKAGPALEGTFCGNHNWCRSGRCVAGPQNVLKPVPGGWGHWFEDSCHSGCILNAKGFRRDQRRCDSPKPRNTVHTCEGSPFRVRLCDDSNICGSRQSAVTYASQKCAEWKTLVRDLSSSGAQVRHNPSRQWQACAVYCKITNGPWYTPRTELNDAGGAFFPDGTWCHNDGRRDYYCQNHVCQRQVSKGRSLSLTDTVLDDPVLRTQPPLGPSRLYPLRPSSPRATSQRLSSLLLPSTPPDPSSFIFEGEQQDTPVAVGILQQPGDVDDQGYTDRDYVTVPGIVR